MIPTSIDGTDITGATIDGTDVQEITVDGQTVFTAVPPLPSQSDLFAHYDPSDSSTLTISGSDVTQIDDKIGTNHLDTARPNFPDLGTLNGNDALVFDRSNNETILGDLDSTISPPMTMGIAYKSTSVATSDKHLLAAGEPQNVSGGDATWITTYYNSFDNIAFYNGNIVESSVSDDTNPHTIIALYDDPNSELYLDDSLIASGATGGRDLIRYGYGGRVTFGQSSGRHVNAKISQGVIYDAGLSRSEITDLHKFLNSFL